MGFTISVIRLTVLAFLTGVLFWAPFGEVRAEDGLGVRWDGSERTNDSGEWKFIFTHRSPDNNVFDAVWYRDGGKMLEGAVTIERNGRLVEITRGPIKGYPEPCTYKGTFGDFGEIKPAPNKALGAGGCMGSGRGLWLAEVSWE